MINSHDIYRGWRSFFVEISPLHDFGVISGNFSGLTIPRAKVFRKLSLNSFFHAIVFVLSGSLLVDCDLFIDAFALILLLLRGVKHRRRIVNEFGLDFSYFERVVF